MPPAHQSENEGFSSQAAERLPCGSVSPLMLDTTLVDLWAMERRPSQKSIDTHRSVARWFYERVGEKPVDKITRHDILRFRAGLQKEGQTAANIEIKLKRLRTLLNYAAQNNHAFSNFALGISFDGARATTSTRKPFDVRSLKRIFAGPVHAQGQRPVQGRGEASYWLPLLALFTGAQLAELGQLRPADILLLAYPDVNGRTRAGWFIKLSNLTDDNDGESVGTKIKHTDRERLVPVHSELERLGFISFVCSIAANGHSRLFHLLKPDPYGYLTHKWNQWFSQYIRNTCGITDTRTSFHSIRLIFVECVLRSNMAEDIKLHLIGKNKKFLHYDYRCDHNLYWLVQSIELLEMASQLVITSAPSQ